MTKNEFLSLFENALELAAKNAETFLGYAVPRTFEIEFHGLSSSSRLLSKESAFDKLYLGPDKFYRLIDISVRKISDQVCTVFLRISGHSPSAFDQTWNQPIGSGPFKQLLATQIEVEKKN